MQTHSKTLNKRSLTEEEAAEYCCVSRSLLRQSRSSGNRTGRISGPSWYKMGKRTIRYLRTDLDDWIDSFPKEEPKSGEPA